MAEQLKSSPLGATNTGETKEKQKISKEQNTQKKFEQQLSTAVNNTFNTFSVTEKEGLKKLFKDFLKIKNWKETANQIFAKIQKIYFENWKNPEKTLQMIKNKLQKENNQLHTLSSQISLKYKIQNWNERPQYWIKKINLSNSSEFDEKIKQKKKEIQEFQKAKEAQAKLKPELQANQSEVQAKLQSLQNDPKTAKKLARYNIPLSDYASFLVSREKITSNIEPTNNLDTKEFLESLKNLESKLGLTPPDAFPNKHGVDKDFFMQNPDIKNYAKNNPELQKLNLAFPRDQLKSFSQNSEFVKKFWDSKLLALQDQVSVFFNQKGELIRELTPTEQQLFLDYRQALAQLKHDITTVSENMLKAAGAQAPVIFLLQHLDQDSTNNQTLAQQLKKTQQNAVKVDQNSVMTIDGRINSHQISFRYDLQNPRSNIQILDHLNYNSINKGITIGESNYTDLNIQFPDTKSIVDWLQKNINPDFVRELLQSSKNWEDFAENLDEALHSYLSQTYSNSEEITSRLSLQVEKNLTTQEFNQKMIPPHLLTQLQNSTFINNNPDIKKLFFVFDFSSEHSNSQDHITFRLAVEKIQKLSASMDSVAKIQDPILKHFLLRFHSFWKSSTVSLDDWTETMLSFFNLFMKTDILNHNFSSEKIRQLPSYETCINTTDLNTFLDAHLYDKPISEVQWFKKLVSEPFFYKYTTIKEKFETSKAQTDANNILAQLNPGFDNYSFTNSSWTSQFVNQAGFAYA